MTRTRSGVLPNALYIHSTRLPAAMSGGWRSLGDVRRGDCLPAVGAATGDEDKDRGTVREPCDWRVRKALADAMGVQQADVLGDTQLLDSVEVDDAPLQRSSESPGMPGHDAFTLTHSHARMLTNSASSLKSSPSALASFAFNAAAKASTMSRASPSVVIR
jgi:hypothetical protein